MKLNYKRTLLVGLAFLSICAFWQLYDNVVPLILKNTFDIPDDIAGVIMALDNVLALFLLPLFGKLSDRTHTRLGRRMPYILGGTLAAAVPAACGCLWWHWGCCFWRWACTAPPPWRSCRT